MSDSRHMNIEKARSSSSPSYHNPILRPGRQTAGKLKGESEAEGESQMAVDGRPNYRPFLISVAHPSIPSPLLPNSTPSTTPSIPLVPSTNP